MKRTNWVMSQMFLIISSVFAKEPASSNSNVLDPTGSYQLAMDSTSSSKDSTLPTGRIQVKLLNKNRIGMVLDICRGAPSYNIGSFIDTLELSGTVARYKKLEYDPTCLIEFHFYPDRVNVTQTGENDCGFGHDVSAEGTYKKRDSKVPILKNPNEGE